MDPHGSQQHSETPGSLDEDIRLVELVRTVKRLPEHRRNQLSEILTELAKDGEKAIVTLKVDSDEITR